MAAADCDRLLPLFVFDSFGRDPRPVAVEEVDSGIDPDRVAAWKRGETGSPMVDANMRRLRETDWLNFRTRALCASVHFHVLQQPWRIGADHFFEHLIDGDPAVNDTQWQSQCGLVGRPELRLYDQRNQVCDRSPDGEFVTRWVSELDPLPATHLDAPERTPLSVQREVGVRIGETYPSPVVDEAARGEFRDRYGAFTARLPPASAARRQPAERRCGTGWGPPAPSHATTVTRRTGKWAAPTGRRRRTSATSSDSPIRDVASGVDPRESQKGLCDPVLYCML